jgi:hypothetical protein
MKPDEKEGRKIISFIIASKNEKPKHNLNET